MIRDAAATGDLQKLDEVMTGFIEFRPGFWGDFFELLKLKAAQCVNYNGIIRVADSIIGDPSSSPEDVAWAEGKKKDAQAGAARNGCAPPNPS